ncbi:S-methyl-5-thioribose-1-phosphate isomerase [Methylobacterium haplocladii]|uniref:Methylthioribose-1-phosphate isomerase n=1 Tax=Methylobacterium haplocladii TaxID=1176176 RepID=A0A512IUK6_9HYPH|nr:S-methyl-5-thioribose-1-phosphate isomerase [Methylobacterium haplocladii]GEP01346.1 methylthioribose-1-phosphate isomerase [Methylobacterium haplocladii]GJD82849.1 Methylthioribose-1-phosphate isomerase [Methylobacterium haplocladii]GLS58237.1 methylthioribose-1-phosphate isomerase [Methylobacterium haplocladii]
MKIDGRHYRTIFLDADGSAVQVIDQTRLPFAFELQHLATMEDAARAIRTMVVRGAPLIGVTAAYGLALAMREDASSEGIERAVATLAATRPTAINLRWALDRAASVLRGAQARERVALAFAEAGRIADEDVASCRSIGEHGGRILSDIAAAKGGRIDVLTHCNAGWLATVDWGTALAPIYAAHDAGVPVHVWVDETRPRNQGAALTAFELHAHGVPHTVIADNAGGHLMQHGQVDVCIVGSDRTTASGDVCNKIGTYLKALAAHDNSVPFYAALPFSTIDWTLNDGVAEIPIEDRDAREVTHLTGRTAEGGFETIQVVSPGSPVANPAFDVTPARLVTGIITERGIASASPEGLLGLYPERRKAA